MKKENKLMEVVGIIVIIIVIILVLGGLFMWLIGF